MCSVCCVFCMALLNLNELSCLSITYGMLHKANETVSIGPVNTLFCEATFHVWLWLMPKQRHATRSLALRGGEEHQRCLSCYQSSIRALQCKLMWKRRLKRAFPPSGPSWCRYGVFPVPHFRLFHKTNSYLLNNWLHKWNWRRKSIKKKNTHKIPTWKLYFLYLDCL